MGRIIFITGGARSGKSRFAEELLAGEEEVLYLATSIPFDEEMRERVALHRERRNPRWTTVEAYRGLDKVLAREGRGKSHILLDCITIMVSNLILLEREIDWERPESGELALLEEECRAEIERLLQAAGQFAGTTVLVSNELGMGLVPPNPLGRYFRDVAGRINQMAAARAEEVYFMVSGIATKIKG